MKINYLLIFLILGLAACGKSKSNPYEDAIESSHRAMDVEDVNQELNTILNQKIKLTGTYSVSSLDSCLMDVDTSACVDVDNNFFYRYSALAGQSLTLYGRVVRNYQVNPNLALIEVYYFKDYSGSIKKVEGRDY